MEMATDYGRRLKQARKHARLTQKGLAEDVKLAQSTLSELENNGHGSTFTYQIAIACGVNPQWLATGDGEMLAPPKLPPPPTPPITTPGWTDHSNVEELPPGGKVPLISWVQAGNWTPAVNPYVNGHADEWLPCPARHGPCTIALRVRGDSMRNPGGRPSYEDGEIIYVDPSRDAQTGDRVVVRLDDQDEATFKQLVIEDGRKLLKALNPEWRPRYMEINGNATMVGVVIGKWTPEP